MHQQSSSPLTRLAPVLGMVFAVLLFFAITTPPARSQSAALLRTAIAAEFRAADNYTVEYLNDDMRRVRRSGSDILQDNDIEVTSLVIAAKLILCIVVLFLTWFITQVLLSFFGGKASGKRQTNNERQTVIEAEQLRQITQPKICQSKASLVGVPLPGKSDLGNLVFCGDPGCGKTVTLRDLLASIRSSGKKAIVFDPNGELISYFYRPDTDIILNPLDARSVTWDIWSDCRRHQDYMTVASNLIPEQDHNSRWVYGAQLVMAELARRESEQGSPSNDRLMASIKAVEDDDVRDILKDTVAATIIAEHGDEACYGIRGILIAALKPLQELDGKGSRFSVRRWAFNESSDSWLFIGSHVSEQEAMRPLTSAWMDLALKTLLSLMPDHLRRFFVVIDDLHALNRIQSLPDLMVQSRRLGVCTAIGIQTVSQIRNVYGDEACKTMLRSGENLVAMRAKDSETLQWMTSRLGSRDTLETIEISYDSHQEKLHTERLLKMPLVNPDEIANLPELNGFIKFGSDCPTARFRGAAKALPMVADPFIPKSDSNELITAPLAVEPETEEDTPDTETPQISPETPGDDDTAGTENDQPAKSGNSVTAEA